MDASQPTLSCNESSILIRLLMIIIWNDGSQCACSKNAAKLPCDRSLTEFWKVFHHNAFYESACTHPVFVPNIQSTDSLLLSHKQYGGSILIYYNGCTGYNDHYPPSMKPNHGVWQNMGGRKNVFLQLPPLPDVVHIAFKSEGKLIVIGCKRGPRADAGIPF
jgi:hypothetical protein